MGLVISNRQIKTFVPVLATVTILCRCIGTFIAFMIKLFSTRFKKRIARERIEGLGILSSVIKGPSDNINRSKSKVGT